MLMNQSKWFIVMSIIILALMQFACFANKAPELVLSWEFKEGQGTEIKDTSGNGYNGTMNGGKWVKFGDGYAVEWFEGSSGNIECLYEAYENLNIKDKISVELLIKLSEYPSEGYATIAMGAGWLIRVSAEQLRVSINDESDRHGGVGRWTTVPIPLNEWVRVGFTYDSTDGSLNLYLNGKLNRTYKIYPDLAVRRLGPFSVYKYGHGVWIRPKVSNWEQFSGAIASLKIWKGIKQDWGN